MIRAGAKLGGVFPHLPGHPTTAAAGHVPPVSRTLSWFFLGRPETDWLARPSNFRTIIIVVINIRNFDDSLSQISTTTAKMAPKSRSKGAIRTTYDTLTSPDNASVVKSVAAFGVSVPTHQQPRCFFLQQEVLTVNSRPLSCSSRALGENGSLCKCHGIDGWAEERSTR